MAAPMGGSGPFAGWSAPLDWSSFCDSASGTVADLDVSLDSGRRVSTDSYESSGAAWRAQPITGHMLTVWVTSRVWAS